MDDSAEPVPGEPELVSQRTTELAELCNHLQALLEQERAGLARALHDEVGGLLFAARMGVSWLEQRVGEGDPLVQAEFKRVLDALQAAVDIKRRLEESLRPTLLDNLGLEPALRWQVAQTCTRAGLQFVEQYPATPLGVTPDAAITVFRIVQEALTNIVRHARAHRVAITLETEGGSLLLAVCDDGVGLDTAGVDMRRTHGLALMRQRAAALGGEWRALRPEGGGTRIEVRLPLERVLAVPLSTAGAAPREGRALGRAPAASVKSATEPRY
jgi:signal transduction histidine kinase